MIRPCKRRRVSINPEYTYFKPRGRHVADLELVDLQIDELEALRLKDYANFDQDEAARKMRISTSTFQRILGNARKKVAEALLHGKAISINEREEVINMPGGDGTGPQGQGPGVGAGRGAGKGLGRNAGFGGPAVECICPACNARAPKKPRVPCAQMTCPKCGENMVRGR